MRVKNKHKKLFSSLGKGNTFKVIEKDSVIFVDEDVPYMHALGRSLNYDKKKARGEQPTPRLCFFLITERRTNDGKIFD